MKKILLGFIMDGKAGGLDTYLLHFIDAVWREGVQIDLLTNQADPELKAHLKKYRCMLFEIANLRHPLQQFRQVRYLIRREKYDIVYLNISTSMDLVAAFAAKSCKVPRRILHSHSGGNDCESRKKRLVFDGLQKICRRILYRAGNEFYACSKTAGYWMYPKKIVDSDAFGVIYNAVDRKNFAFAPAVREEVRKEMGLEGKFVVGHAGNFCYQKNHEFLIRVFQEIHKREPEAVLLLAGRGVRYDRIKTQVKAAGLAGCVRFLGWRKDVDRLFQAIDVFLLPSWFEGLPTVGIEAQCTGLPCVMSESISREVQITDRCRFLSLADAPEKWAAEVLKWKGCGREEVRYLETAKYYSLENQKEQLDKLVSGGRYE